MRTHRHSTRSLMAILIAAGLVMTLPFASARASVASHGFSLGHRHLLALGKSPLSARQIRSLAANPKRNVIILLRNQFPALSGHSRHMLTARQRMIDSVQAPILAQLRQVHARNIKAFHIVDAISAHVSTGEMARLRADPRVKAVVPNRAWPLGPVARPDVSPLTSHPRRHAALPPCSSAKPMLEPQALQLTHTAYADPKTPQAQNIATGSGVKVAIISGNVDPWNPDFIRPNGQPAIVDYENFGGSPPTASAFDGGWDAESFLDLSSIASQGNQTFNLNQYTDGALGKACENIRILGMAPGASILWMDVVGENGAAYDSQILEGIEWAVTHGAKVMSESFGSLPNNDTSNDIVSLADQQAVADGVTVVVSSGDQGINNNLGSPATSPAVISAGATTSFQYRMLIRQLQSIGLKGWTDNNIIPFSSGGISQLGNKTVDVVAPGAFNFIDCTPSPVLYPSCTNNAGEPMPLTIIGGTSESAPLTAGEAALVIQAYRGAHGGRLPSPGIVKRIITGTSTDLHVPTYEQGAGLINSFAAVQAARSYGYGASRAHGQALLSSPTTLKAVGLPGQSRALHVTLTNDGDKAETVHPAVRTLGRPSSLKSLAATLSPSHTVDTTSFTVPKGVDRLDVSIAWNVVKHPFSGVDLRVFASGKRYVNNSEPGDFGFPVTSSGYGHLDVRLPHAGVWQAQILESGAPTNPYYGPVRLDVTKSNFVSGGTATDATIAPGHSHSFTVKTRLPARPGDQNEDLQVMGKDSKGRSLTAGAVPIILRALVPVGATKGSFSGVISGSSGGRATPTQSFAFNVPKGRQSLGVNVVVQDKHTDLQGVLVDPSGMPQDVQSTVTSINTNESSQAFGLPNGYRSTMQLFRRNPQPGRWRFELQLLGNVSGTRTAEPYTGSIQLDPVRITATGLPADSGVTQGRVVTAHLKITNTGNTNKSFYIDPRLDRTVDLIYGGKIPVAKDGGPQIYFGVLPETTGMIVALESLKHGPPLLFNFNDANGVFPFGAGGDPDIEGTPSYNVATQDWTASGDISAGEVPSGLWVLAPTELGPWPNGARNGSASAGVLIATKDFARSVSSSTGSYWTSSPRNYRPLSLPPGGSGTIKVKFRASGAPGTTVRGALYVETMAMSHGFTITSSPDEVAKIPFKYTIR